LPKGFQSLADRATKPSLKGFNILPRARSLKSRLSAPAMKQAAGSLASGLFFFRLFLF
jgi:hypothetical protein